MSDSELFVKLRDCFTAGYTLPQYCIDNGIKRPLFVSEKKYELFVWQVYVQFIYDRRLKAQFCFLDAEQTELNFRGHNGLILSLKVKKLSDMNLDAFDKIILLTTENFEADENKLIRFADLERFFIQRTYAEIPLLHFLQRFPKVKLFVTNFPYAVGRLKGWAEFRQQLPSYRPMQKALKDGISKGVNLPTTFDKLGYTNSQVISLLEDAFAKRQLDGTTKMFDNEDPLIRIKNGKRLTACQPEKFLNRIYIFGTCHFYGVNAPFDKTIASYLQQMLNEADLPYRVENEGQCFCGRHQDMFYNLNALNPAPNDIVIIYIENVVPRGLPFVDVRNTFDPPNDYREIFCRKGHVNELGYKLMAEKYFKFLMENNFFRDMEFNYPKPPPPCNRYGIPPQFEMGGVKNSDNEELTAYKQSLRAKRLPIGAIVMNCNPFTLGHQYLVEYAAAQVVRLYIFVVEEDRSEFPFADRLELVKQGVAHLSNVEVLPSGKFIISQTTFSGYFNKADLQDVAVDSSEDVEIFGKEIAPTLGITIRFAGSEPKDNVTRQYNETMKAILPRYGVEFREIPRKEFGDEVISASSVREALKVGDFDKIKKLVPPTTLYYLRGRQPARMDIKLATNEQGDFQILNLSDDKATIHKPGWFQKGGIGYVIQSRAGRLEFIAKAAVNGRINFYLRGVDVRYPKDISKRVPYWIDYTKLAINGETILDTVTPAWHDKAYLYSMEVKAGEEVTVQIEWQLYDN